MSGQGKRVQRNSASDRERERKSFFFFYQQMKVRKGALFLDR